MVRTARAEEAELVANITAEAFGFPKGGERWQRTRGMVEVFPESYLVIEANGEVRGALRLTPEWMQVGSCNVLKGEIGDVAVRPDSQGQGLGTQLMQCAVEHMRAQGFHFSRLGGLVQFYSRFGYEAFPRGAYEFPVEPAQGGARLLMPEEALRLPAELARYVRRYDPGRDWHSCQRLAQQFNQNRTAAPVRHYDPAAAAPTEGPNPRGFSFVFDDGNVRGYVFGSRRPEGLILSILDAKVGVDDAAFQVDRPETLWAPLKALLVEAARINCQLVSGRLPFDPLVEKALREGQVLFRRVELQGGPASNMIRVINLPALLQAIRPELQARWGVSRAAWRGTLELSVGEDTATISFHNGQVEVGHENASPVEPCNRVRLSAYAFMSLLLGLRQWHQVEALCTHDLTPEASHALGVLFPAQPTATGVWG
jgi:predicted N-acetyltransferase YhbS